MLEVPELPKLLELVEHEMLWGKLPEGIEFDGIHHPTEEEQTRTAEVIRRECDNFRRAFEHIAGRGLDERSEDRDSRDTDSKPHTQETSTREARGLQPEPEFYFWD